MASRLCRRASTHLPYADPNAPQGGRIVFGLQGTFDSLNPLVVIGVAPDAVPRYVQQSLLYRSADEPFTAYGLLAAKVELNEERTRLAFEIDERARFSDGRPVTADDVVFTYRNPEEQGQAVPSFQPWPRHEGRCRLGAAGRVRTRRRLESRAASGHRRHADLRPPRHQCRDLW